MHQSKMGKRGRALPVKKEDFDRIVKSVSDNLKSIAYELSTEIHERFPREEILEAMGCVYPQFWHSIGDNPNDAKMYHKKLEELILTFSKDAYCNGQPIEGILNLDHLRKQCKQFALVMKQQLVNLENPFEPGSITRLWKRIDQSEALHIVIPEYLKLVYLCQTMILGSVEDERVFSALGILKSKIRNKLDKNLETCLRLFVTQYNVIDFPYDRALEIQNSMRERRGVCNTLKAGGVTASASAETNEYAGSQTQSQYEDKEIF